MRSTVKIVFVCTGNTGRSMMMEALANVIIRQKGLPLEVLSRGLNVDPSSRAPEPNAAAVLQVEGIDVAAHRATELTASDVDGVDAILTATAAHAATIIAQFPAAAGKTHTLSAYATGVHSDISDAYGQPMPVYERVLAQIRGYLPAALARAVQMQPHANPRAS